MNRFERRKAESIKRKVRAMKPAARELAIQTGMELHDAFAEERAEKRKQEIRSIFESEWASKRDELYKQASEEQANRFAERVYGALRWLATTYHGAKTGVSCPDLVASCRRASGFRYKAPSLGYKPQRCVKGAAQSL